MSDNRQLVVCLDPGHGGPDSGCTPDGFDESAWAWDVRTRIVNMLSGRGWRVAVRDTKIHNAIDPTHEQRAAVAREGKADMVFCLHANASDPRECGPMLFRLPRTLLGSATQIVDDVAIAIASRICRRGQYVDMRGNVHPQGRQLRIAIEGSPISGRVWHCLRPYAEIPAVLIEFGFASSRADRPWLDSEAGKMDCAESVLAGIRALAGLKGTTL